jgi:hypothetical protein
MRLPVIVTAALALVSAPYGAGAAPMVLKPGQSVTLTVDDGGRTIEARRGPAWPITPFEAAWLRQINGGRLDWAIGSNVAIARSDDERFPPPGPVPAGEVAVKLVALAKGHMVLVVVNGYPSGLKYRARLRRDGRAVPTDVCEVIASKRARALALSLRSD